jgi:serine/threonine protein kinase
MQCRECHADLPSEARFCLSCGARVPPPAEPAGDPLLEALDKAIGFQYRIERLLGRGGMGAVYLAHELALDRDVAIKVLPPENASTPEVRERFKREARTAARLNHPNIVPLHTFGEVAGMLYFVMGYVPGESLAARLKRDGPLDGEAARTLVAAVCDALDYAHRQGIVHRDIKPDNILVDPSGAPLLTDFGIAKSVHTDAQLTSTGQSIGTPHYMSPEQAMGRADVGPKSDLYSLGVVAYQLVSGARPFEAATPLEALTQRLTKDPRPLASVAPGVPADYATAVHRCLQREAIARWPDAKSVREALLPSDDEQEYSPVLRMLQTITTLVLPLALVAYVDFQGIAALSGDVEPAARLTRIFIAVTAGLLLVDGLMAGRLWRQQVDLKSIVLRAVQQPDWSRGWYPRPLRRRGDVWDRLPASVRQFRAFKSLLLASILGVFVPFQFAALWQHRAPLARALNIAAILAVFVMLVFRNRVRKELHARAGLTPEQASTVLSTPTWRVSAWRRDPAAAVLRGAASSRPLAGAAREVETTRVASDAQADQPTHLSS